MRIEMQPYLAVPYLENGVEKPFYIDFIVRCNNGKIGLLDTKEWFYYNRIRRR